MIDVLEKSTEIIDILQQSSIEELEKMETTINSLELLAICEKLRWTTMCNDQLHLTSERTNNYVRLLEKENNELRSKIYEKQSN